MCEENSLTCRILSNQNASSKLHRQGFERWEGIGIFSYRDAAVSRDTAFVSLPRYEDPFDVSTGTLLCQYVTDTAQGISEMRRYVIDTAQGISEMRRYIRQRSRTTLPRSVNKGCMGVSTEIASSRWNGSPLALQLTHELII